MYTEQQPTLVDSTAQKIIQYILDHNLSDGDRLPTERDLAALLLVGRSTLREAQRILVSRNVLEVRRGSGTFVSYKNGVADDPLGFHLIQNKEKLAWDLLQFRLLIEPPMAAWAAQYATSEEIAELEYLCDSVDILIKQGQPHMQKDMEFHTRIARCSRNLIMPNLLPIIHGAINLFITRTKGSLREETMRTHRAILNAIHRHDSAAAQDAMYLHLIYNRDQLRENPVHKPLQTKPGNSFE